MATIRDKEVYRQHVQNIRPDFTDAEFDSAWANFLVLAAKTDYDPLALIQAAVVVGFDADIIIQNTK